VDIFDSGKKAEDGSPLRGLVPIVLVRVWAQTTSAEQVVLHPVGSPEINHQWLAGR